MNFGEALEALRHGKKVTREGWNGKGQFVFQMLASRSLVKAIRNYFRFNDWDIEPYEDRTVGDVFVIVTAKNVQVGWLATQSDMLADDWQIVE